MDYGKTVRYRRDGQLYERSPYALVWDDENYYLVPTATQRRRPGIRHYRVDKMANLSVLEENFKKISRFIAPAQVIPVLKADAYGMGALEIARVLTERCGCKTLACSQTYEAWFCGKAALPTAEILIMGPVLHDDPFPTPSAGICRSRLFTPERVRSPSREAARQAKP